MSNPDPSKLPGTPGPNLTLQQTYRVSLCPILGPVNYLLTWPRSHAATHFLKSDLDFYNTINRKMNRSLNPKSIKKSILYFLQVLVSCRPRVPMSQSVPSKLPGPPGPDPMLQQTYRVSLCPSLGPVNYLAHLEQIPRCNTPTGCPYVPS